MFRARSHYFSTFLQLVQFNLQQGHLDDCVGARQEENRTHIFTERKQEEAVCLHGLTSIKHFWANRVGVPMHIPIRVSVVVVGRPRNARDAARYFRRHAFYNACFTSAAPRRLREHRPEQWPRSGESVRPQKLRFASQNTSPSVLQDQSIAPSAPAPRALINHARIMAC